MGRTKTLGGSDIPAVAGLDPYRTPLDVFCEKKGLAEPRIETWPMKLGTEQEALVANWYARETGYAIQPSKQVLHPKFAFISGTPDRIIIQKKKVIRGLECKFRSERMRDKYGDPGTDEVLPSDLAQCSWYMLLFPMAEAWDVAVQFGNQERLIYTVPRDAELIEMFLETGREFWESHVLANVPPPLDGSKSATEYLKRKYPQDSGPMLEPTDAEILAEIQSYQYSRNNLKHLESEVNALENNLKSIIGDCAGMQGAWGKITWRKSKDSEVVDWKGLANYLIYIYAPGIEMIHRYTTIKPGSRRWLPKFKED